MSDYRSLPEPVQASIRSRISSVAILFGSAVWTSGGVVCLTFAEVLGAKLMLPLASALTLMSMATIWIVGVRLRKIRGVPSLLENLAEKAYGKQINDRNHPVRGEDNE